MYLSSLLVKDQSTVALVQEIKQGFFIFISNMNAFDRESENIAVDLFQLDKHAKNPVTLPFPIVSCYLLVFTNFRRRRAAPGNRTQN
jgi:hypothetical protein